MAVALLLSSFKFPLKSLAATSNQTNVTVNISTVTKISVIPTNLTWYDVQPSSVGGMKYLDVKNTGSTNISTVYAYVDTLTTEPTNPIPTGNPVNYSSGGVLVLKKNETGANWYYAGRIEWNISKPTNAGGTNCANAIAWGYYRNASGDYLWCLTNGTEINDTHGCNSENTKFYIEKDIDDGSADTRAPEIGFDIVTPVGDWGIVNFATGPLAGHCVALHRSCEKIYIYRYDRRTSPDFNACGLSDEDQSIRDTTLVPGDQFTINADVWVPAGIPAGWLASSWLTLEAAGE